MLYQPINNLKDNCGSICMESIQQSHQPFWSVHANVNFLKAVNSYTLSTAIQNFNLQFSNV